MRMASALKGISVLIVEDDPDALETLSLALGAVGATVHSAASAEAALGVLQHYRPDVVLSDIQLPGVDGFELLELLRANPRLRTIPAAALTGITAHVRDSRSTAFEKYLTKPTKLSEIVIALASLASREHPDDPADEPSSSLREALARVNAASRCRYTSLLRFAEDNTLTSIWTYDRERPRSDPFPIGLPIHASYCVLVRDSGAMAVIEDARRDPRVATHAKRNELARYIGVPLFRSDGTMFGTLCCYDSEPHAVDQTIRDAVAAAAREIEPWLNAMFAAPADGAAKGVAASD
jgi:CheY-like chemotaxis protein